MRRRFTARGYAQRTAAPILGALLVLGLLPAAALADRGDIPPHFTSATSTTFVVGSFGSFTVIVGGRPVPTIVESGALPAGVGFVDNANGSATLSGTPGPGTNGTWTIVLSASNGVPPNASQTFTLTVTGAGAPTITSAGGTTFVVGVAGSFTVTTTGTPTPTLTESGALPANLAFTNNGNGTATISGTPIAGTAGTYPITITAANGVLPNAVQSFALIVSATAGHLVFSVQPGGGVVGVVWGQQPVVQVLNSSNQVLTADSSSLVTLTIATNPAGGVLSCTGGTTMRVTNGVARFSGCSISVGSASSYTLQATSSAGYLATTSAAFLVSLTGRVLVFATQPGGGTAGVAWSQQPRVAVADTLGNIVTSDNSTVVTLALAANPAGGTLSCTSGLSLRVTNGIAAFSGCSINIGSTSSYALSATGTPAWTPATSSPFLVSASLARLTITDAIARGVNRGTSGFGTSSVVVAPNAYITILATTSPSLVGASLQIWVKSKTSDWHLVTTRRVASDGTMHYFARVNGWTGYWVKFVGNTTYGAAHSHGRVATNPA